MKSSLELLVVARKFRLLLMALLVLPTAYWAMTQVYVIFHANELRPLEWVQLALASVLFLWLAMAFWTAIIGFFFCLFKRDPLSFKKQQHAPDSASLLMHKHAIIMPVYNEDTNRIMAGFEASVREIEATRQSLQFDFYMLSDTQNEAMRQAEKNLWEIMIARLPEASRTRCFYRNRIDNSGRKVGNIKDFCQRWGYQYESMIVLDADSVMTGRKMLELTQRIEANPSVGLIQTIPMPIRQHTFFGRFVQFAAHVYSPMLATGLSFWQGDCANYWGHNAAVRVNAFIETCGLPRLKGKQPFGGDILSHDFVEAALLRRANWQVFLLTDASGSYEEVPSNIIDYATRDRRWVQGNMQHLSIVTTKGLHFANRLHFTFGAFAYTSSILLLSMLLAGTADALIQSFQTPIYFTDTYQLFPTWLITKQNVMITTLWVTVALLFLPKMLGIFITFVQRRQDFGGGVNFLKSAFIEFWFAVLLAPVMMMFHSYFVLNVLVGKSVKWEAQARDGRMIPWRQALRFSFLINLIGITWASVTYIYTPTLFLWLLPVFSGLILAAPIIRLSSSNRVGIWCLRKGILLIAPECKPNQAMRNVNRALTHIQAPQQTAQSPQYTALTHRLPTELWLDMPSQPLARGIYADQVKQATKVKCSSSL